MFSIAQQIAKELNIQTQQVEATIRLMDEGATVPFIARYRKEVTNGLDDTQLRNLDERLNYLKDLEARREVILKSISDQDKLSESLKQQIMGATTKTELEDLYLPYKPKRITKGQLAITAGLEPLADALYQNPDLDPELEAAHFLNTEHKIDTTKDALEGARYILMERFAENAQLLGHLRDYLWSQAQIKSSVIDGQQKTGEKFSDYFEFHEALNKIPSHRALALFRGRNEGILQLSMVSSLSELEDEALPSPCLGIIADQFSIQNQQRPADSWLDQVVKWTWKIKLQLHMESELFGQLRELAEGEAIKVFARNLNDLLMAAPAGRKVTLGLDPGLRTGVKAVVVDDTGKLLHFCTIFPHAPQNQWDASIAKLKQLCQEHQVNLVSIGNGTASRETDNLVKEVLKSLTAMKIDKMVVSEAGASVYSASELAAKEFPDLDVTYRGAVSIARRLQDPLAELVKIDPKSIGVGQYQHDVSQIRLARSLEAVVEDCVNAVGVDLNTASSQLLSHVSGLNKSLANNIVNYRDTNGRFTNRANLLSVPRLGPKAYEQAAGFLRIVEGENPLDGSSVHPEAYPLVEKILVKEAVEVKQLIGNSQILKSLKAEQYVNEQFGLPTVKDIIAELEKPGRDPRPAFKTASFKEGVEDVKDLKPGMKLEGVITNVTNFGAFVDIGVHQDGLVHISLLADRFVANPHDVVKAGDVVQVRVVEVDAQRKRISLTMRSDNAETAFIQNTAKSAQAEVTKKQLNKHSPQIKSHKESGQRSKCVQNSAFADALNAALLKK
ncbi:MAG: RNA-binding transcriptional accessory protein [Gammaproteobacteria bacterium CG22_combo_CG10-13_8_21_14_all_40_8]|nr:MAG: RNA-binding transcriptional accessory protein [Gammaproteobacteria bacterium CG22_combo_CG10-13_8_21_14_all_40_8]